MKIVITGGYGFIGSNMVEYLHTMGGHSLLIVDSLTYATRCNYLNAEHNCLQALGIAVPLAQACIGSEQTLRVLTDFCPDVIINFAAESHVDRSLADDGVFFATNVMGVRNLLNYCKLNPRCLLMQISTDEVGGSLDYGSLVETDSLAPANPYAATKAMAELLCYTYGVNFGVRTRISRGTNTYGKWQYPEKLVPKTIKHIREGKAIEVYDGGLQIRDWLHVSDHCSGIWKIITGGVDGEIYHVGGENELQVIEVINTICACSGVEVVLNTNCSRLGNDQRYSLDCSKLKALGWQQQFKGKFGAEIAKLCEAL